MKKIIISDELRDFVEEHASSFTGHGNRLFYVGSGREALDVHAREKGDLIIIKPDFPDMTCEQLCSAIKRDGGFRGASLLVICADDLSEIERSRRCGASDYLKTLTPGGFLRKVTRLLNISERTRYKVIVKVARRANGNLSHVFCTSQDISASGILLETESILDKGEKITCSFFLPSSVQIVAEGEVVRVARKEVGPHSYGVRFLGVPASVQSQITSFIDRWLVRKKRERC